MSFARVFRRRWRGELHRFPPGGWREGIWRELAKWHLIKRFLKRDSGELDA